MPQWAETCDMQAATDRCSLEIAVPDVKDHTER